ncbi:MAG: hypothetical protein KKF68_02455 [Nanoarchaeota archaeon]|nr:hypothetical protein [Nanoarchaeota archaeon]
MSDFKQKVYELRERVRENYPDVGVKPHVSIQTPTLNDLYFQTILEAVKHGRINLVESGSFAGEYRLELDHATLIVTNPTTRPLAPIPREGVIVTTNDEAIEEYFNAAIICGDTIPEKEHYTYGAWLGGIHDPSIPLEKNGIPRGIKFDQIEWCINHFVNSGFGTNHCAMTVGCAEGLKRYDWTVEKGELEKDEKPSTECLRAVSAKIKRDKLNLSTFWRSWDLAAGLPQNLGGLVRLMEYMGDEINKRKKPEQPIITPGVFYATSDGLHIYEHNLDLTKLILNL